MELIKREEDCFSGLAEINKSLYVGSHVRQFLRDMTKSNFMCDVGAMLLVKLGTKKKHYIFFYQVLSSWFNPRGCNVSGFLIQKFSFSISLWRKMFFWFGVICKLIYDEWLCVFVCLNVISFLEVFVSSYDIRFFHVLRWLFSVILKRVSDFPTYCFLHKVHSIR